MIAPCGAGASAPIASVEAAAGAGIVASAVFTGADEPAARPERIAGAVERSCPGSLRQQEAAFRTGPPPGPAMQEPQRSLADGIFMPQLMIAPWQGATPMRMNARRTDVLIRRFMNLSSGDMFPLIPQSPNDAPTGPRVQHPPYITRLGPLPA